MVLAPFAATPIYHKIHAGHVITIVAYRYPNSYRGWL